VLRQALNEFIDLLKYGNMAYKIKPVSEYTLVNSNSLLHSWRGEPSKEKLLKNLTELARLDETHIPNEKIVQILDSGKYDYFDNGESIMVLDYPHFINTFLNKFFYDLVVN